MTTYYTSDHHIGHKTVARQRWDRFHTIVSSDLPGLVGRIWEPPDDDHAVVWHNTMLAENWDRVVSPTDTVWVLGDLSLSGTKNIENALEWVSQRPGYKKFVVGNHDGCHPGIERQQSGKWFRRYSEAFDIVVPFARIKVNGSVTLLSHFPYQGGGDHTFEERYTQWRLPDMGEWLLHGHTHSSEKVQCQWRRRDLAICTSSETLCTVPSHRDKMIHIGVDSWDFTPVSQEEIIKIMESHDPRRQEVLPGQPGQ